MHILKVFVQSVGETLMFRFKERASASSIKADLEKRLFAEFGKKTDPISISDDYGLSVTIPYHAVLLVQQIDLEKMVEGDATMQFNQQKIGNRTLGRLKSGSPIITPLDNGLPGGRRM